MKPRVRKGVIGVGWVVTWGGEEWMWYENWEDAIAGANFWASILVTPRHWLGGA